MRSRSPIHPTPQGTSPMQSDPRWPALAEGTLSAADRAALEAEAARTPEGRALWEMYRPFGPEEDARLVGGLRRRLSTQKLEPQAN